MAETCDVVHLTYTGKRIAAGQGVVCVSEDRLAPYVHDRHRADHGIRDYCWRCAMTGADRIIRWSTAGAVVSIAAAGASVQSALAGRAAAWTGSATGRRLNRGSFTATRTMSGAHTSVMAPVPSPHGPRD